MNGVLRACRHIWSGLRTMSGDDAYERYLEHRRARHPAEPALDRAAFYRSELDRRSRGVSRCC